MIDGINVLNKFDKFTIPDGYIALALFAFFLFLIIGFAMAIVESEPSIFFLMLLVAVCSFVIVSLVGESNKIPTGEYTYQVTIEDSVKFKEFDEKYKVIKQEGDIYYIEEKDSNNETDGE